MSTDLPRRVLLGGADWFMVTMDRHMRRTVGIGGVCHLWLRLETPVADLNARLATHRTWSWLRSLRLRGLPPFIRPAWVVSGTADPGVTELGALADDVALLDRLKARMDIEVEAPVALTTATVAGAPVVVLSWHHALLDAKGAERLLLDVGGMAPRPLPAVVPAPTSAWARLWQAKAARDFIYEVSTGGVGWLLPHASSGRDRYLRVRLSPEALARADVQADRVGAGALRSALHIAAGTRALASLLKDRGQPSRDLLVPAPVNQRRTTEIGNAISLLFYRVPAAATVDLEGLVRHATEQVRQMIARQLPAATTALLDMCVRLPSWFYGPIVRMPTRGRLATLGVSDIGDSCHGLTTWCGAGVVDVLHVPANLNPPGVSLVFTRFRGAQDIVLRWRSELATDDEIATFMARLHADLEGTDRP